MVRPEHGILAAGESLTHLVDTAINHSLAAGVAVGSRRTLPVQVTSLDAYLGAGFAPADFLDIAFSTYKYVYIINEPSGRLDRCRRDDLDRCSTMLANLNMIATQRPDHLEIINGYAVP